MNTTTLKKNVPAALKRQPASSALALGVLAVAAALSAFMLSGADTYYVLLATRALVFGLAAVGLNLILGFGGMVSFGHALYLAVGAYVVAVLGANGISNGWLHLTACLVFGTAIAALLGAIALRTSGLAFIMITLAFAQMFFYLIMSLKQYGGDEGLPLAARSSFFGEPLSDEGLFIVSCAVLAITLYLLRRLLKARFGMVLTGCRQNERRMLSLGFATTRYRLAAYVLSAQICVVAGALLANLTKFASPSYGHWLVSGELIAMIALGGIGSLIGPVVGAGTWILLEEVLTSSEAWLPVEAAEIAKDHWMFFLGLFVIFAGIGLKQGVFGSLASFVEKRR